MKSSQKSLITERWVINASPVIALARVGQVDLLLRLPTSVVIPQEVAEELTRASKGDPARLAVESGLFPIVATTTPPPALLAWDLGAGETAVLAYAMAHAGWVAVLDDSMARRCARSFSVRMKGTLAIVILAKQHGLIKSATQVLRALRSAGFRLDDAVICDALARTVGEQWQPEH